MRRIALSIVCGFLVCSASAQFFNQVNWEDHRHQIEFGLGVSNFLGDLGGKDGIGTNDLKDLEPSEYNFGGFIGHKYALREKFFLRTNFSFAQVSGNDELTEEAFRNNRNLHFKSNVFELSLMAEFELPLNFRKGHVHDIKGVRGWRNGGSSIFIFGGIGGFYFNPKAQLDGTWYELHALRTEGQGLPGGPEEYRRVALSFPVGLAITKRLAPQFSMGLELTYRYTTTDYMDDVSSRYYNPYDIALYGEENAELAAYFSNPALGLSQGGKPNVVTSPGQQRGDPEDDDGWMLLTVKCQYLFGDNYRGSKGKFKQKRRVRPMRKPKRRSSGRF